MHRKTKSKLIAAAVLTFSFWGFVGLKESNDTETKYVYVPPTPVVNNDPFMARTIECKEFENKVQPCHRLQNGKWQLVMSFAPMRSIPLYLCNEEDGGSKLPCIWQDTNKKKKKSDPTTRNVFWKGRL